MSEVVEFAFRGLLVGMIYGMIALPISLLFVTTETVDLSVGAYAVLASAVAMLFPGPLGLALAILVAVVASGVVASAAMVINKPGEGDHITVALATFGAAVLIESVVLTFYGKDAMVRGGNATFWNVGGVRIDPQWGTNAAIVAVILALFWIALFKTPYGRSMRASSVNPTGAALAGIRVRAMWWSAYLIGGLMSGIAGLLLLYTTGVSYSSSLSLTTAGFGAAILFGLRNPLTAFAGGLIYGIVEALSTGFLPSGFSTAMPLVFIFVILATSRINSTAASGGRA